MVNYIFTVKNFCSGKKQLRMELIDASSAPALLEKLSYMFHPSIAGRIISSEAVGKDRVLTERNYNYAMLMSHYRPDSAPIVHDRDILMVDFLYSDQEGCEDLRRLLESASVLKTLERNQFSTIRAQYLQFWSEVQFLLSEEFIAKFLNDTRTHTLQGHGRDYFDIYKSQSLEQYYFIIDNDEVTDAVILFVDWMFSHEDFMEDILEAFIYLNAAPSIKSYERDFLKLDQSYWSHLSKKEKIGNLQNAIHELAEQISRINQQIAWLEGTKFIGALPTNLEAWCGEELQQLCIDGNLHPISECESTTHHPNAVNFSGIQLSESLQDDLANHGKLSG